MRNIKSKVLAIFYSTLSLFFVADCLAQSQQSNGIKMQFSDGRPDVTGFENVNPILYQVGVRASLVNIPKEAKPILEAAQSRPIDDIEKEKLLSYFSLSRADLLEQINLAGRVPEAHRGGYLTISASNGGKYPSISDLLSLNKKMRSDVIKMYGKLHVNSSENGMGIDEVMTVISGGPFTWFFVLKDGIVARLTCEPVLLNGSAIRVSYPGLTMHAGYFPEKGIAIGYAHGPESFVIRFEETSIPHSDLLNTNPWIDFSGETPKLLDTVK